jgi:hypothetical protein
LNPATLLNNSSVKSVSSENEAAEAIGIDKPAVETDHADTDVEIKQEEATSEVIESQTVIQECLPEVISPPIVLTDTDTTEPSANNSSASFNQLTTANLMSDSKVLAQKKKKFFMNELVKCPYEDHTYAISSNSIAMALQSSNIFNQNNSNQNLSSFLGQVKDIQMNPKLQKILGKVIEENEDQGGGGGGGQLFVKAAAEGVATHTLKQFCNLTESVDSRDCFTCHLEGDHAICGRLLPFDSYWVHVNCLLWSEDVTILNESMIDPIESILVRMKTVNISTLFFSFKL